MQRSQEPEPAPDQEGSSLRPSAQHGSSPSGDTISLGRAPDGMQQAPPRLKEGEGEQEESSLISVRSRRSRAKRRPRPQQPEQAPASASARAPAAAAAAAHDLAPDTAGSHMLQHAHKRARMEPDQAPGRTGAEALQQASVARPAQAFTPIGTPQRLSTPEAAEIRSDMIAQNAPGTQHDFHASGSRTPQLASQQRSTPLLTPGVGTPPTPAPQAARGQAQIDTPAGPALGGTQEPHKALLQHSTAMQKEASVPMQLHGSGVPLSAQTRAVLGSLESVWAARQPTLAAPAQQHALAPVPGQPLGSTPNVPTPDQQALLSALLRAITRHKQPGMAAGQSEAPPQSDSSPAFPLRPKAIRRGLSPQPSAFRVVEQAAAAVSAPAMDPLAILAHLASQQQATTALRQPQLPQQSSVPIPGQGMLAVAQMLAQQPGSFSAGDSAMRERHPDLWRRVFLAGQPGQAGQADQAQPDFGQSLEQKYKSLSNQDPSSIMFKARSQLPNPFAQLSSQPLQTKLPDLATPQKKPSRRRAAMPDLTEGGGDSDTVSVLSQHHSLKPEPEVTGPLESTHTIPEALNSEAARVRKELAGALDFSGSSKPGLPTQLQSFSQEIAPKGTVPSQDLAKAARSALLGGQHSSVASMGRMSMHFRQSDVSAASYQVLDTILSQAHREGGQIMSSELEKFVAHPPAPIAAALPPPESPKAASLAGARLQSHQTPFQALLRKSSVSVPPVSPSADTGDGGNPFGMPEDKAERRKANNRESARRTRAKKSTRLSELEDENGQLKTQLQGVQQQLSELRALLQTLPQISQQHRQLIEENDSLRLEVQGLRSLMQGFGPAARAAGLQPPGGSQPPR